MKKLFVFLLIVLLSLTPIFSKTTYALTTSDVQAVAPQMQLMFSALKTTVQLLQKRIDAQNTVLKSDSIVLSNVSLNLSEVSKMSLDSSAERAVAANQLNSIVNQVSSVAVDVNSVANERRVTSNLLLGIMGQLQSILTFISSAR